MKHALFVVINWVDALILIVLPIAGPWVLLERFFPEWWAAARPWARLGAIAPLWLLLFLVVLNLLRRFEQQIGGKWNWPPE